MATELTESELQAIEARCAKATPEADWDSGWDYKSVAKHDPEGWHVAHATGPQFPSLRPSDPERWRQGMEQIQADSDFILHARADVPALLAEVRRLRASGLPPLRGKYPLLTPTDQFMAEKHAEAAREEDL